MHSENQQSAPEDEYLADLVAALHARQEPAASRAAVEIARRFHPLAHKYWRSTHCGDFRDFFQEVMVRLFQSLPGLATTAAFPGFFKRVIVATAADYWRDHQKHESRSVEMDVEALGLIYDEQIGGPVAIQSYLNLLPPQERQVLVMGFLRELDSAAIAKELGITPGAVRMTRTRALQRLREKLGKM